MNRFRNLKGLVFLSLIVIAAVAVRCTSPAKPGNETARAGAPSDVERGKYLVKGLGCSDCHSPKIMTAMGPIPDSTRELMGHPADAPLPEIDWNQVSPGKWLLGAQDLTAWVGPWGVSFAANLTPDSATGSGSWTTEMFNSMMRTGHHMGSPAARPILPPMPWMNFANFNDGDLKAIFAYLKSIPAHANRVPDPLPPPAPTAAK